MKSRLTALEGFFLLIGTATIVYELVIVKGDLTLGVLGFVLFCFGYVISSVADRDGTRNPLTAITELVRAIRGESRDK